MRDQGDRPKARRAVQRRPSPEQPASIPLRQSAAPYAGERWETFVTMLYADAEQHADFLADRWPDIVFPRYAVQALIPQMDAIGEQGWEPVSVQPVIVGENGDITMLGPHIGYSYQYLCVFKRRIV